MKLVCHPSASCMNMLGIEVAVRQTQGGELMFGYLLSGDLKKLRIPPPVKPRRTDHLWQHSCFEAFIAVEDQPDYLEFNFSPSGQWAAYAFSGYRERRLMLEMESPEIALRQDANRLELDATIRLGGLLPPDARLKFGLTAVVEDESGQLSYWALGHPSDKPDFHHAEGFTFRLLDGASKT